MAVAPEMSRVTLRERFCPLHQPDDVVRFLERFPWSIVFKAGTSNKTIDAWLALSILAEIVQTRTGQARELMPAAATSAVDRVCGMHVDIASARHTAEAGGVAYYFCCANCRAKFLEDQQASLAHP
jgi:YHS domain-containing protein